MSRRSAPTKRAWQLVFALLGALLAACTPSAAPLPPPPPPTPTVTPPVELPRDAAPHDVLTEWWYYTGHLRTTDGRTYGFEFTVFQGTRRGSPTGYLSHFALTDVSRGTFSHAQRAIAGDRALTLDLDVGGWRLTSDGRTDRIEATMGPEPGVPEPVAVRLDLVDEKPPALHAGGYIDYGPAGGSYYYSRTRIAVSGELSVGEAGFEPVTGTAWMDHQWGNFVVGPGGWDWFSLQLEDRTELMLYILRAPSGESTGVYGTRVDVDGTTEELPPGSVRLATLSHWTSPHTGATYPSAWIVEIPERDLKLEVTSKVADQELYFPEAAVRTPVYWEGAVAVRGLTERSASGEGYVELTGYAP